MSGPSLVFVSLAAALALASLGGGLYEFLVVDPFWPRRPDLIQPLRGGISRRRFWIPAHTAFELALIAALGIAWGAAQVRVPLLVALASHSAMRGSTSALRAASISRLPLTTPTTAGLSICAMR